MVILGVDPGMARTGLALCDKSEMLAFPLGTLVERDRQALAEKIAEAARNNCAELIVLGLPRNMDGSEGESAKSSRELGGLVEKAAGLKVEFCDERGSTVTAHSYLNDTNTRGKKRKAAVDQAAATVILQSYIDARALAGGSDRGQAGCK